MIIYQGLQILFSSLLTMAHRRWIRPDEEAEAALTKAVAKKEAVAPVAPP